MGTACTIYPFRKTINNEVKESRLFKDLLSATSNNRKLTVDLYYKVNSKNFLNEYADKIKLDDLNEPTFKSLLEIQKIKEIIKPTLKEGFERSLNTIKDGEIVYREPTFSNYNELFEKVVNFNQTSNINREYLATVSTEENGIFISLVPRTVDSERAAKNIEINNYLNKRIIEILNNKGITINVLDRLESAVGFGGKVDYKTAEITTNGIINLINLANGIEGVQSLPEEYAHFAIDISKDTPTVQRLFHLLKNNTSLLKEALGENYDLYAEHYSGNIDDLVREAAGKLVSQSWFEKNTLPEYKSFIQRVISSIKNVINKLFNKEDFLNAKEQARKLAETIGDSIISDISFDSKQLEKLKGFSSLYNLSAKIKTKEELAEKELAILIKDYKNNIEKLERRLSNSKTLEERSRIELEYKNYKNTATLFIQEMQKFITSKSFDVASARFINNSIQKVKTLAALMEATLSKGYDLRKTAYFLRYIKNGIDSIKTVIDDIDLNITDKNSDLILDSDIQNTIKELKNTLDILLNQYNVKAFDCFSIFLKKYFPEEGITMLKGKEKVTYTKDDIDRLLKTAEYDSTLIDNWLQSASNNSDLIVKLSDRAIKERKTATRLKVQEYSAQLAMAYKKLKNAGFDDSFMFERTKEGKPGYRYISDINWTKYYEELDEEQSRLKEKYKEEIKNGNYKKYNLELNTWYTEHLDPKTRLPKYHSDALDKLTKEQKDYYNTFMKIRAECLMVLPNNILEKDPMRAVQISANLLDKIKNNNITDIKDIFKEQLRSTFTKKEEDSEFGSNIKRDFNGKEVYDLPLFYIKKLDNPEFLSRDTASSLVTFANMAINYSEMSKIIDIMELGTDVMSQREAFINRNNKFATEKLQAMGIKVSSKIKVTGNNNFVTAYQNLLNSQMYGRLKLDNEIKIGNTKLSTSKVATFINRWTALNSLAVNLLAGVAAVSSDIVQVNSEVLAGAIKNGKAFFTAKELAKADFLYFKNLPKFLGELGSPLKESKLGLFIEKFNVTHNYENNVFDAGIKKSKLRKALSENTLYFLMSAGAHWGETRTALAQALYKRVTTKDGKEISLWDALEVKERADGTKYLDTIDSVEPFSVEQYREYEGNFIGLNQDLFGIYNSADSNAFQKTAIGAMVMLFRKYFVTNINRRYAGLLNGRSTINLDQGAEKEGYYTSAFKFIGNIISDSKNLGRDISLYWEDMTDFQRSNCMRALNELLTFTVLSIVGALLIRGKDDNDDDNPWIERLTAYVARRLKTETGAFTPVGIFGETWNIVKNPAAAINTFEDLSDALNALKPSHWVGEDAIVQNGKYKGKKKGYRDLMNSPFVPMNKTIYKALHPDYAMRYYNLQN